MLTELKNLGLSEKEAKVYLAALELGSSSVQKIGRKAGVNRATTYVMIESLIKRGLVSSFEQGKKRFFAATHPSQLVRLIRQKELDIQELKENLEKDLLPQLLSIHNIAGDKPKVRFFEGKAGLQAMADELKRTKEKLTTKFSDTTQIIICGSKLAFVSLKQEKPIGIMIEDRDIAQSVKGL